MKAALAILAAAALAAGCGEDAPEPTPPPAGAPPAVKTAAAEQTAAAATPVASDTLALWPPPARALDDPVEAAQAFVEEYIGLQDPALSEFREGEPHAGEIDVYRKGEDGAKVDKVVSTLSLRRLDDENWFVTSAQSPEVELTAPEVLAAVGSPVTISGRGRGFEGNIVLEVRAAYTSALSEPLAREPVTAGSAAKLERFKARLEFKPTSETGAIVAKTGSGIAAADGFAAFPLRFKTG